MWGCWGEQMMGLAHYLTRASDEFHQEGRVMESEESRTGSKRDAADERERGEGKQRAMTAGDERGR